MSNVNLLPGYGIVTETDTKQNLLPGYGILNETFVTASTSTTAASTVIPTLLLMGVG